MKYLYGINPKTKRTHLLGAFNVEKDYEESVFLAQEINMREYNGWEVWVSDAFENNNEIISCYC